MSKNESKNDVVIVELDRPRELRFGHKALKKIDALNGNLLDDANDDLDFEVMEKIFYFGLEKDARDNGETLTLEMMEDILDAAPSYPYLMEKMQEAMQIAMGGFNEGNVQAPVGKPVSREQRRASGTGKKV
ncbi:hypothetical protein QYF50_18700 [Paenibacillus vini]|uniref:hypothetical protein n=1 Tax=Paenibacillus vini TaxID=1476024 RepID=UPI0025B6E887|nr:hypothetical protein [Paenibacillus vini]MDN4069935.1 hypothetical protein [Paenibacillus vini]